MAAGSRLKPSRGFWTTRDWVGRRHHCRLSDQSASALLVWRNDQALERKDLAVRRAYPLHLAQAVHREVTDTALKQPLHLLFAETEPIEVAQAIAARRLDPRFVDSLVLFPIVVPPL